MTLVKMLLLWCEAEGCEEEFGFEHEARTLRLHARESGWIRRGGGDYCPNHARPTNDTEGGEHG